MDDIRQSERQNVTNCFHVSDLHGFKSLYLKLFSAIEQDRPKVVFLGGDLLPHGFNSYNDPSDGPGGFLGGFLADRLTGLREELGSDYPEILVILGNDDPRAKEIRVKEIEALGIWKYIHNRRLQVGDFTIYGYACVPPSPFLLKDWERYDISRYVDPGCVSPEDGRRSVPVEPHESKYRTIQRDLEALTGDIDLSRSIFLFHTPPYQTNLDRAALDGQMVDHVPLDVHIGSQAVRRFIEARQPLLTLHGHIHESTRITGQWQDRLGKTLMFNAATDGPELSIVKFTLEDPAAATRLLV